MYITKLICTSVYKRNNDLYTVVEKKQHAWNSLCVFICKYIVRINSLVKLDINQNLINKTKYNKNSSKYLNYVKLFQEHKQWENKFSSN